MPASELFETPLITFNLVDRGRKYIGKERRFKDCLNRTVNLINSGAVQERVKCRDMKGYLGHQFRTNFGLLPPESVIIDGKSVVLEAAFISTHIKAHKDGTVEHKAQFLTTPAGRLAQTYYENHTGGFSSAFDSDTSPTMFCGFDYVDDPNYVKNRGYPVVLDSARASGAERERIVLDGVLEYNARLNTYLYLLDSCTSAYKSAMETVAHLQEENTELLSMLATGRQGDVVLDSAVKPIMLDQAAYLEREADVNAFFSENIVSPFGQSSSSRPESDAKRMVRRVFGTVNAVLG